MMEALVGKALPKLIVMLTVLLVGCRMGSPASPVAIPAVEDLRAQFGKVVVEVGYLDHQPMRGVLADVDKVLASYGDTIHIVRYNLDTPEGTAFTQARNITGHTPISILVNGATEFKLADRTVRFYSFPGSEWQVEDLRTVIDQEIAKQ